MPYRTTRLRAALSLLTASLLPQMIWAFAFYGLDDPGDPAAWGKASVLMVPVGVLGAMFTAPIVLAAGLIWFFLHRAGRATPLAAALVGAGAGVFAALLMGEGRVLLIVTGTLNGLLAWRIAYRRAAPADA